MKNYQYQIIRYKHDLTTGEFVNVGVVIYSLENNFLRIEVAKDYTRACSFFPTVSQRYLQEKMQEIAQAFREIKVASLKIDNLKDISKLVLNEDDGCFEFTVPKNGIDISLEKATEDIFERYVNKHTSKPLNPQERQGILLMEIA
ncbi:MAG: DUF3037 domain-containing protein [Bacteroidetes bacterium]|nr:MAG: DUF3037 domain-containing protein [Bacteroidota bacterium]